jgi:hypothetical protein
MKDDDLELSLQRRFAAARSADESAAPDIGALLDRPRRTRPVPAAARRLALAAALALAAVAAALLVRARPLFQGSRDLPPAAGRLASWTSPTASLLRTPGAELGARVPALVPRVPVFASLALPQITKGADR